jgi:hypothetical protein
MTNSPPPGTGPEHEAAAADGAGTACPRFSSAGIGRPHEGAGASPGGAPKSPPWTGASLAGLALVGLAFVIMAALTWRKWPDAVIDFGTQLYIPWRILHGSVLYRDLFYIGGGPLPQYFNALLFKIFGVSFSTLIATNLLFSAALLVFIYRRFLAASDVLTATMICLGIVMVFTFGQFVLIGNYNYIAPYAHEALYGVLVSLFAIGWLSDWFTQQRLRQAFLIGLAAGIVVLTKPDIFLAFFICVVVTFSVHWLLRRDTRFSLKSLACFTPMFLLPPLCFFLFFLRVEDWRMSLRSVVFGWLPLFQPGVETNPHYLKCTGLDRPLPHLEMMVSHFVCGAVVIGVYALLFRRLDRWKFGRLQSPWVVWLMLLLPLLFGALKFPWINCGNSFPLWCLTAIVLLGWQLKRAPGASRHAFPFLWSVFALVLMAKLGVYARISHCGFALAMPAFVITVYLLSWLLPRLLQTRWQVPARYLRGASLLVFLICLALLFKYSSQFYQCKHQPIGHGGDEIVTYGPSIQTGDGLKIALDWMDANLPPQATLAVIPDGITLNYLTRRINPTPCLFWDPVCMAVLGQDVMTDRFQASPPDYVLLLEQDDSDFGIKYFGSSPQYGERLMQWIKQNYKVVLVIGNVPLRDGHYGLEFLQRLPPAAAANKLASAP